MGIFTYTIAGAGFLLIGALESFFSVPSLTRSSPSSSLNHINKNSPPPPSLSSSESTLRKRVSFSSSSLSVSLSAVSILSFLFIINSLFSLIDAFNSKDRVGSAVQLEVISIALLFLFYAILGVLIDLTDFLPLPSAVPSLICLFSFVEEFLLFYLQRKDPSGIENRYFDLLLVPITICVCSAILELRSPKSGIPRFARGVGLILQGMWFLQMAVSFFTDLIAHGCSLHQKSRGNYTIRCKSHPEYHRARAIATLQFNCHLAFLVVLIVGVYSIISRKYGHRRGEFMRYRPLGAEMQQMDQQTRFTLDSDDDADELKEDSVLMTHEDAAVVSDLGSNGYGSHQ